LGVLLYALLTGTTPFPEKRLRSLGYGEMQRVILEEEPERPSTRLRKTRETGELSLGDSKSAIRNLQSEIDTDLDWIVMKCLEKDRQRRYETANGLASDIQRHLSNEPVFARPPSAGYRFQKAIRRNKAAFVAASAVAAALIVGLGISSWMFIKEKQAYRRAVAAEHKESILRESADKARAEEANARQMAEDARQREAEQRSLAEARAYAADINLAQQALAKNNFGGARQLLDRHYPQPGQTNRPGWEWRYLWGQSRSDALFKVTQKIGTIISLAVSSDGRTLAVGLLEGGVSVLDISNLRAPRHIAELEKTGGLAIVDFSPREPLLAYSTSKGTKGGIDGDTVTLWNMEKKQAVATLPYERSSCSSLRFLANGESLAVCVSDTKNRYEGRVDLLSVPGLKKLASFTNYTNAVSGMGLEDALAPDQTTVAIASESLQVIDLSTGAVRWSAKTDATNAFGRMALSPDGKTLFSTEGRTSPVIRIWDFSTGKEIGPRLTDHRALVTSLIVTADGKTLVSGSADQTIRLWDVSDPAQAKALGRPLQGNRSIVSSLALLPDDKTVLSASGDGSVYAWDITATRKDANPIILPKVGWWVFDREGKNIFTADRAGQISRWNGENFQTGEQLFNVGKDFYNACFSRDGRWFATGSTNGAFELWDLPQRKRLGRFGNYPGKVDPWDFSPDGTRLLVLDKANQLFCEWDVNTVQQTRAFPAVQQEQRSSFSVDWRWFMSASYMGNFSLEEATTGRHFSKDLEIHNVISTAFSRDGKHFAAASFLGFAKVWETETFRPVATVGERSVPYYSVNFSPDGTRLITGSGPSEAITIWDLTTELELIRLEGKSSQYGRGRFSPDGNVLAAWGTPGELHLWRAPSWAEIEAREKEAGK
jgi:WD40 repeat protein